MTKINHTIIACSFLLTLCLCRTIWINTSKDNDLSTANSVGQLQISSMDVTGWKQTAGPTGFCIFSASNFNLDVDGGVQLYIQNGLIEVADQRVEGASGKQLTSYCMDFGNEIAARKMFDIQKLSCSTLLNIPYYSDTVGIAGNVSGGKGYIYAHFKKFYIELLFIGLQDQTEVLQTASLFLDIYSSKIE